MAVHVHVNCAITLDGCLGGPGRTPLEISNAEDKRRVHELRASVDAILVGVGTIIADDPHLTVKWSLLQREGEHPLRVVLDPHARTPASARVLNGAAPTLLFCAPGAQRPPGLPYEEAPLRQDGLDLHHVLGVLERRGVRRLMVEGGARTLGWFFSQDLVDEATIFISPRSLGAPDAPRLFERAIDLRRSLQVSEAYALGDGVVVRWQRPVR